MEPEGSLLCSQEHAIGVSIFSDYYEVSITCSLQQPTHFNLKSVSQERNYFQCEQLHCHVQITVLLISFMTLGRGYYCSL